MESLKYLIGAANQDRFLKDYLDTCPFFVSADRRDTSQSLVTTQEVLRFLSRGDLIYPQVRVAREGRSVDAAELLADRAFVPTLQLIDQEVLFHEVCRRKSTLIIQAAQFYFPGVGALVADLHESLLATCHVNIYVTPPNSEGFGLHWDNHDVFVLQIEGHKCWEIYEPLIRLPRPKDVSRKIDPQEVSPYSALKHPMITKGDCLYLPRGYVHKARTTSSMSIHATIGFQATTYADVLEWLVENGSVRQERLRQNCRATNPNLAADASQKLFDILSANGASESLDEEVRSAMLARAKKSAPQSMGPNWLSSIFGRANEQSVYHALFSLEHIDYSGGQKVTLNLRGKSLQLPGWTADILIQIADAGEVSMAALSNLIAPDSAGVLLHALIENGYVKSDGW